MDSGVVAAVAAVVSAIVAGLALLSARSANERANTIAANNSLLANEANRLARSANDESQVATSIAKQANEISLRAADEARRSADAAEASLDLQRRDAEAAELLRHQGRQARVEPICWESRAARAEGPQGFQVKNYGPALAEDIRGYVRVGDSIKLGRLTTLGAGDLRAVGPLEDYYPVTGLDGIPAAAANQVAGRVIWKNPDGSEGNSGWQLYPRH